MAGIIFKACLIYGPAAIAEIFGCYCFWLVFREGRSVLWLFPALGSLVCFAFLLTFSPSDQAGRAFAIYGGIYILSSLFWMGVVEGNKPDIWDVTGAAFCLAGAALILLAPRSS